MEISELKQENERLREENKRLREENIRLGGATTLMACCRCGNGVRPRYAVHKMCGPCAANEIDLLRKARGDS